MREEARPSNRSEAALLSLNLSNHLAIEGGLTFREEFEAYNLTFREVTRQVAVHCSERGELLERLLAFYTVRQNTPLPTDFPTDITKQLNNDSHCLHV